MYVFILLKRKEIHPFFFAGKILSSYKLANLGSSDRQQAGAPQTNTIFYNLSNEYKQLVRAAKTH